MHVVLGEQQLVAGGGRWQALGAAEQHAQAAGVAVQRGRAKAVVGLDEGGVLLVQHKDGVGLAVLVQVALQAALYFPARGVRGARGGGAGQGAEQGLGCGVVWCLGRIKGLSS